jgi:sugar diacid utilization regulator
VAHVRKSRDHIVEESKKANLREVPQLAKLLASGSAEELQRGQAHYESHAEALISVVENDFDISYPDFDFVARHGAHRARQKFPLAATLHGYRIGQRVCWMTLCDALTFDENSMPEQSWRLMMALSVFSFEYINHISSIVADAYYEETRRLELTDSTARAEFVDRLIRYPDDPELVASAARFNLTPKADFVTVVARGLGSSAHDYELLHEMRRRMEKLLFPLCTHRLAEIRHGDVIFLLAATGEADRKLERALDPAIHDWLSENNCRIGISALRQGLNSVSGSYKDALMAIEQTSVEKPVLRYNAISLLEHLVSNASRTAYRMKPAWVESLIEENERARGVLLQTLNTYINCRMSAKKAADILNIHTNTVYQRINRVEQICSRSGSSPPDLIDILVAARLHL